MCSEEIVVESFEMLKGSYSVIVLRSGAPYETKMKIYKIYRDLVDEINSYGKRVLGHDLVEPRWLREPRIYRLSVKVRGKNIPKDAVVEVIGSNYSEKERVNPKENAFNLAEGEYIVRLSIEGNIAVQKQVFLDRDSELELSYQEPQKVVQRQAVKKIPREVGIYIGDPSLRILYIAVALIAISIVLQIIR
ncbi:hypothetical protein ATG_02650 [Desulfurococcaceae archaeon AG1]|nr:hypothetical protein ATG_02650 [Desulfurococcaceae archaeon AG1]